MTVKGILAWQSKPLWEMETITDTETKLEAFSLPQNRCLFAHCVTRSGAAGAWLGLQASALHNPPDPQPRCVPQPVKGVSCQLKAWLPLLCHNTEHDFGQRCVKEKSRFLFKVSKVHGKSQHFRVRITGAWILPPHCGQLLPLPWRLVPHLNENKSNYK